MAQKATQLHTHLQRYSCQIYSRMFEYQKYIIYNDTVLTI